jgi:hypothetical protein
MRPMKEKPKTHCGDLAHLPAALAPLTAERRWVVWPWELRTSISAPSQPDRVVEPGVVAGDRAAAC